MPEVSNSVANRLTSPMQPPATPGSDAAGGVGNPAPAIPSRGGGQGLNPLDHLGKNLGDDPQTPTPPGAPPLQAPLSTMSPTLIGMEISKLVTRLSDFQAQAERGEVEHDDQIRQQDLRSSNEKIDQARQKIQEAAHKSKQANTLSLVAKILTGAAAIVLTAVSGGAATPFTLLLLAYTVVDTSLTVADTISTAEGHGHCDLDSLLKEGLTDLAKACGADQQTADKVGQWGSISIQLAIAVASVAYAGVNAYSAVKGGVGAAKAAESGIEMTELGARTADSVAETADAAAETADAAAETADAAAETADAAGEAADAAVPKGVLGAVASKLGPGGVKWVKVTALAVQFFGSANQVASGGLTISAGKASKEADDANADKARFDAATMIMEKMIQTLMTRLQEIAAQLSQGIQTATNMVAKGDQTASAVVQNTV